MNPIIITGHPYSGYEYVHRVLLDSGVRQPKAALPDAIGPAQFHENLLKAYGLDTHGFDFDQQLAPEKIWHNLATNLFFANLGDEKWCWADARSSVLLDFWKDFDPRIGFVLVYSAPGFAVSKMLRGTQATPEEVQRAVATWETINTALFRFYIRHQSRCLLINAAAAYHSPQSLRDKMRAAFGIESAQVEKTLSPGQHTVSIMAASLAQALIEDCDNANALYQDLESAADLPATSEEVLSAEKYAAWQEYMALLEGLEISEESLVQLKQHATALERQLEASNSGLDALVKEKDHLTRDDEEAHRQAEVQKIKADELAQENELLLMQLHQVQEELEHYLLEYQKHAVDGGKPVEMEYDVRADIDGDNWYYAESDGRWAGPETTSTLKVPRMGTGRFAVEFDVVDAIELDILSGMRISLNGVPLEINRERGKFPARLFKANKNKGKLPMNLRSEFSTEQIGECDTWQFQFMFPRVLSPSERGEKDTRKLAIRLRTLRLRALDLANLSVQGKPGVV